MLCSTCGLWELAGGDLLCAWCGASYLRFTLELEPAALPANDYPPPVELAVANASPLAAVTLERLQADVPWVRLVPGQGLPVEIQPRSRYRLYLDVDTFAAGQVSAATIAVTVRFAAAPATVTLRLQPAAPEPAP